MWPGSKGFSRTIVKKEATSTVTSVMHDSNEFFSPKDGDVIVVHETSTVREGASNVVLCDPPPFHGMCPQVDVRKDAGPVAVLSPTPPHSSAVVHTETHSQNTLLDCTKESNSHLAWWKRIGKKKWYHTHLAPHSVRHYHCNPCVSDVRNELQPKCNFLTSENARNTSQNSNEGQTDKSNPMATLKSVSNTYDLIHVQGNHPDPDQANMNEDEIDRKISFSTTPLLLEAHNAITDSLLKNEVPESQTMSISSDMLPLPSFLPITSDDMATFSASSDFGSRHEVSSFCYSRTLRGKDKYFNLTHPLHDRDSAYHSFPPYFPKERRKKEHLLRPVKMTDTIEHYKNSHFTTSSELQASCSVIDRSSARCSNKSNWIPLSSSHRYNQPSSISSEDMIRTLAHGMALSGFNYIAPLTRSQKHYSSGVFPCNSIRSVSSSTVPLWSQENHPPSLDEPGDIHLPGELEQNAFREDVISCQDANAPGPSKRQNIGSSLENVKSFSTPNDNITLIHPTTSSGRSRSLWGPPTRVSMRSDNNVGPPSISNHEGFFVTAPPHKEDERGVIAAINPNNVSDSSKQPSLPFPPRISRTAIRKEASKQIRRSSSEPGDLLFREKTTSTSFFPLRGKLSLVDHSPPLAPQTDPRELKETKNGNSKSVVGSDPPPTSPCWTSRNGALHESSPLAWGQWRGSITHGRALRKTNFLIRLTTCASSGDSTSTPSGYRNPPQSPKTPSPLVLTRPSGPPRDLNVNEQKDPLRGEEHHEKRLVEPFPRQSCINSGVVSQPAQVTSAVLQQISIRGQRSNTCTFGFVVVPSPQQIGHPPQIKKNEFLVKPPNSPCRQLESKSGGMRGSSFTTSFLHLSRNSTRGCEGAKGNESPLPLPAATWGGAIASFPTAVSLDEDRDFPSELSPPHENPASLASFTNFENLERLDKWEWKDPNEAFEAEKLGMNPPNGVTRRNLECSVVSVIDMGMGYEEFRTQSPLNGIRRTFPQPQLEVTPLRLPIEPLPMIFPEMLSLDHQSTSTTFGSREGRMERILRSSGIVMSAASAAAAAATSSKINKKPSPLASPLCASISCETIQHEGYTTSSHTTFSTETFSSRSGKGAQSCRTIGESKSNNLGKLFTTRQGPVKVPSFVSPVDVEALLDAAEERMRKSGTRIVQLSYLSDGIKTFPKSFVIRPESSGVETSASCIFSSSCPKSSLDATKAGMGADSSCVKNTKRINDGIHIKRDEYEGSMSISQQNSIDVSLTSFEKD
ncbi:unnamed protein product [Phytomonas sp. Hart1]|nr:unnamed protein product [Phytomonas sp. Hart1]|eukprot:CCW70128.1 unnamed protein product [Phytomonas sp. isolate Hart1]